MKSELQAISSIPVAELAARPAKELMALVADCDREIEEARVAKEWLESVIGYKFVYRSSQLRAELQQEFGEVEFEDDGVRVISDWPREVIWDQKKLSAIAACIRAQGEDPSEFLDIQYNVPEERFDYWPESIQRAFEAAFTIKAGRPTYRLVALSREVAA